MTKRFSVFSTLSAAALCAALSIAGCGNNKNEKQQQPVNAAPAPVTLSVFAAASLTEALTEISALYKASAPAVTLSFNFDSSGKLQTQIENGAEADVFFSAGQKQMDALAECCVDAATRKDLLVNKIVLIAPQENRAGVASFEDCMTKKVKLIALGNESVPVGQYAKEIFESLKGWDKVSSKASLGTNVKEVLSQTESGSVDCGVVYSTDAATSKGGIKVVATAPEGSHKPAVYPAAALKKSANAEAAKAFLDYLSSPEAVSVFEKIGFETVK
ncbi:MAG: molybdate ABC transporter substrate-binding protein [Chitinispirillales bacterium]|jgi:molybdate transport system substrate-binding protein|nr:molybdate ABC transporter substrate-binding protein [Chitinispirillales bacterium]